MNHEQMQFGFDKGRRRTVQFDGATYDAKKDERRLSSQLERVKAIMLDGEWRTLAQIAQMVNGSEPGVSARLRDLRKKRFGSYTVNHRRVDGEKGLWQYQLLRSA